MITLMFHPPVGIPSDSSHVSRFSVKNFWVDLMSKFLRPLKTRFSNPARSRSPVAAGAPCVVPARARGQEGPVSSDDTTQLMWVSNGSDIMVN